MPFVSPSLSRSATEIYRHFGFANGYWIPMTASARPQARPHGHREPGHRAHRRHSGRGHAGQLLACSSAARAAHPGTLTLLFAWLAYSLNNVNYGLFTLCLTAYLVCLLALNSLPGNEVAYHRAISTIIGGALALTIRLIVIRIRKQHATHPSLP